MNDREFENVISQMKSISGGSVKLEMKIIESPTVNFTPQPGKFALESYKIPLHVEPPSLECVVQEPNKVLMGIPSKILFIITNKRNVPITDVAVVASVMIDKKNEIGRYTTGLVGTIDPQSFVTDAISIVMPVCGTVKVRAEALYRVENSKASTVSKMKLTVEKPIEITYRVKPEPIPMIQVNVTNLTSRALMNINADVAGRSIRIADFLDQCETGSGYTELRPKNNAAINVTWDLPGILGCRQMQPITETISKPSSIVDVSIIKIPKIVDCFQPFGGTISIRNNLGTKISGEMALKDGSITLFGLNTLAFTDLAPDASMDIDASFVALTYGKLDFPNVQVAIKEAPVFEVSVNSGVLVLGNE